MTFSVPSPSSRPLLDFANNDSGCNYCNHWVSRCPIFRPEGQKLTFESQLLLFFTFRVIRCRETIKNCKKIGFRMSIVSLNKKGVEKTSARIARIVTLWLGLLGLQKLTFKSSYCNNWVSDCRPQFRQKNGLANAKNSLEQKTKKMIRIARIAIVESQTQLLQWSGFKSIVAIRAIRDIKKLDPSAHPNVIFSKVRERKCLIFAL